MSVLGTSFSTHLHFKTLMKNWRGRTWLVILLAAPILLWALPASFFDNTGVTLCASKLLFNMECMGCGMTRAVMHLHHFQFEEAWGFNRGVVFAYPALVLLWGYWVKQAATSVGLLKKTIKAEPVA